MFSTNRPTARRRTITDPSVDDVALQGEGEEINEGRRGSRGDEPVNISSAAELNLAYHETRRLPDVAGEDKVARAAAVLRIDLTETGIRT